MSKLIHVNSEILLHVLNTNVQELTRTYDVHRSLSRGQLLHAGQSPHSRPAGLPSSCSGTPQQVLVTGLTN